MKRAGKIFRALLGAGTQPLIDPGKTTFSIDNNTNTTDTTDVDVTPNSMSTTSTKVSTGDGTTFFNITAGATATGDFTLTIGLPHTPATADKSAKITISDDSGNASDVDITVNYTYVQ